MPGTVKSELFPDAVREIQMWLAGDENFLESSLDNGHFITGMISSFRIHLWLALFFRRDDFFLPDSSLACSFLPQG